jgi:hypothetical protein
VQARRAFTFFAWQSLSFFSLIFNERSGNNSSITRTRETLSCLQQQIFPTLPVIDVAEKSGNCWALALMTLAGSQLFESNAERCASVSQYPQERSEDLNAGRVELIEIKTQALGGGNFQIATQWQSWQSTLTWLATVHAAYQLLPLAITDRSELWDEGCFSAKKFTRHYPQHCWQKVLQNYVLFAIHIRACKNPGVV